MFKYYNWVCQYWYKTKYLSLSLQLLKKILINSKSFFLSQRREIISEISFVLMSIAINLLSLLLLFLRSLFSSRWDIPSVFLSFRIAKRYRRSIFAVFSFISVGLWLHDILRRSCVNWTTKWWEWIFISGIQSRLFLFFSVVAAHILSKLFLLEFFDSLFFFLG